MNPGRMGTTLRSLVAMVCAMMLVPGDTLAYPPQQAPATAPSTAAQAKIPPEQLDSLVAPIALYPDPLLAQVLAASTYPLEIILLQRWLENNKSLKDKALADAVAKEPWDPSVQALAALPEVVKRLGDDIQWTSDLGNAFLAQQADLMDAVQRMRKKAQEKGTLKTTEQQTVETKVIESKSVVVIEQANPQVVYVPSYDPVVVYGPAYYPYPSIYYPWYGYAAAAAVTFGVGMMMGAFWGGGWGWGCGWGGNNVYINNNNNFNRNSNINRGNLGNGNLGNGGRNPGNGNLGNGGRNPGSGNRPTQQPGRDLGGGRSEWKHSPEHRGGTPYRDRATADRFGGTTRGDSLSRRQAGARDQLGRQGGNVADRGTGSGLGNRTGGAGGAGNRAGSSGLGSGSAGGADRIGGRDLSRSGGGNREAFGGGTKGYSGSSARGSSTRGSSSMSRGGGGGMSRGGGGGGRRR
ncbi:MAG: DUF3300 domain-containing protein [Candidatus Solibacter sp.]